MHRRDGNDTPHHDDDISVLMEASLKELESKGWKIPVGKLSNDAKFPDIKVTASTFLDDGKRGTSSTLLHRSRGFHLLPRIRKKSVAVRANTFQLLVQEVTASLGDFFRWCATTMTTTTIKNKDEDGDDRNDPDSQALHCYLEGNMPQGHDFLAFLEQGTPHYKLPSTTGGVTSPKILLQKQLRIVNQLKKRDVLVLILILLVVGTVARDLRNLDLDQAASGRVDQNDLLEKAKEALPTVTAATVPKSMKNRHPTSETRHGSDREIKLKAAKELVSRIKISPSKSDTASSSTSYDASARVPTKPIDMALSVDASTKRIDASKIEDTSAANTPVTSAAVAIDSLPVAKPVEELEPSSKSSLIEQSNKEDERAAAASPFQLWRPRTRKESKQAPVVVSGTPGTVPVHPRFRTISRAEYIQAVKESMTATQAKPLDTTPL